MTAEETWEHFFNLISDFKKIREREVKAKKVVKAAFDAAEENGLGEYKNDNAASNLAAAFMGTNADTDASIFVPNSDLYNAAKQQLEKIQKENDQASKQIIEKLEDNFKWVVDDARKGMNEQEKRRYYNQLFRIRNYFAESLQGAF